MVSNRVRFHIMALLVVLALMPRGILSAGEALSGFGNSAVVMFASLLVVGEMLDRTGVARAVGDLILKRGGCQRNETVASDYGRCRPAGMSPCSSLATGVELRRDKGTVRDM